MSTSALVLVADGSEDIETVTVIDVLRRASLDVVVASAEDSLNVKLARGVKMEADALLRDVAGDFDVIVVPGGMPGAQRLSDNVLVAELLKKQALRGKLYENS